jgi:hypothetical protein
VRTHSEAAGGRGSQESMPSRAYGLDTGHGTRVGTRAIPSAGAILAWLERHASTLVQEIPAGRRPKNRAILQYRDEAGEVRAVGGATIAAAVWKAEVRQLSRSGITCTQAALGGQKGE